MAETTSKGLLAFLLLALGVWVFTYWWHWPHIEDDALISARYAVRLAEGKGLSWNDGYFVEGYSNLAWVLATAGLVKLGFEPILALRLLGIGVCLIVFAALAAIMMRPSRTSYLGAGLFVVGVSLHGTILNALGGLEAPLVMACTFFASFFLLKWCESRNDSALWAASVPLALLCLTRPDGPLFTALFPLVFLFSGLTIPRIIRNSLIVGLLPVAAVLGQLAFRLSVYGAFVPNTARVKLNSGQDIIQEGLLYVGDGILNNGMYLIPILFLAVWKGKNARAGLLTLLAMIVVWCAYLVWIGGDIFFGYRHLMPVIGISLGALPFIAAATQMVKPSLSIALAISALLWGIQFTFPMAAKIDHSEWIWRCKSIADDLKDRFGDRDPLLGATAAGCLPFWTEFETVDLLGLNDLVLPGLSAEGGASYLLGHKLGNMDYLLERSPEIVVFNDGLQIDFAYRDQAKTDPRFDQTYCEFDVPLRGYDRVATLYLRRDFLNENFDPAPECFNDR